MKEEGWDQIGRSFKYGQQSDLVADQPSSFILTSIRRAEALLLLPSRLLKSQHDVRKN